MCLKAVVPNSYNIAMEFALEVTLQVQLGSLFCIRI